jgi:hypothetical protein
MADLRAELAALPPICGAMIREDSLERCSLPPEHEGEHGRRRVTRRANWVGAPEMYNLDLAVCSLAEAFGPHIYHVGSSLERRDFRDVDVRCILPDDEYDRLFPLSVVGVHSQFRDARLLAMNAAFSEWLRKASGLPVDFQFQRQTQANEEFTGTRSALGMHFDIQRYQRRAAECASEPQGVPQTEEKKQ